MTDAELLRLAASAERGSEHPLAEAIVRHAAELGIAIVDATAFEATAGRGVRATIDGSTVLVGTPAFLDAAGVDTSALESVDLGTATGAWVARDGRPIGVIGLADTVKPGAAEAV